MQKPHLLPSLNILPHQISADWPSTRQSLGMFSTPRHNPNQAAARHAEKTLVKKLEYLFRRVVSLDRARVFAHSIEPLIEGDYTRV